MTPDVKHLNQDTDYLRGLIAKTGLSQREAATRLGVPIRQMRYYLNNDKPCPYTVQFALECLAEAAENSPEKDP